MATLSRRAGNDDRQTAGQDGVQRTGCRMIPPLFSFFIALGYGVSKNRLCLGHTGYQNGQRWKSRVIVWVWLDDRFCRFERAFITLLLDGRLVNEAAFFISFSELFGI